MKKLSCVLAAFSDHRGCGACRRERAEFQLPRRQRPRLITTATRCYYRGPRVGFYEHDRGLHRAGIIATVTAL